MQIDSLIFDLDGTLWDSSEGILATWAIVMEHHPDIHKVVTAEEMAANFGRPLDEIAARMFPDLPHEKRMGLMQECCDGENDYLAVHGGRLYPALKETLEQLAGQYPLFIVSNCQDGYIQSFYKGNKTGQYFKDCECIGVTGLSKGENIRLIMERNHLKAPVYVGDTQGDADAARAAGIPFIFARYGFGNVDGYDMVIDSFAELKQFLKGNHPVKGEFVYTRRANYYETDQMGVIHHSNYIRWFEEARLAYFSQAGMSYRELEERKIIIPVIAASCRYKQSVHYDDVVDIHLRMTAFSGVKFSVSYRVLDHATGMLMAEGETEHCFLNERMQPFRMKKEAPDVYAFFASCMEASDNV